MATLHRHTLASIKAAVLGLALLAGAGILPGMAGLSFGQDKAEGAHEGTVTVLSTYLAKAAMNNPGLEASFNNWKAALARIPQVGAMPDPRFTFAYFVRSIETRTGPQRARVGLAQTFPWFGKLGLKESKAAAAADAAKANYDAQRLKLFTEVKTTYYEYAYLAQSLQIARENLELTKYLVNVVQTRYSSGAAPYADAVKTQVALSRNEDMVRTLEDRQVAVVAKLNAAMNEPVRNELPLPAEVPVMRISLGEEELMRMLSESNPELRMLGYQAEGESVSVQLAEKDYFPDLTFALETIITDEARNPGTPDSGEDPIIAGVSLNIPLWQGKRRAAVEEAQSNRIAVLKNRGATEQRLLSDLQLKLFQYRDAERKIDLYRNTLIPLAEQSFNVTLEAFQAGSRSSFDLMEAEKTLLDLELDYVRALTDQAQRLAEMEQLVGENIPCEVHGEQLDWPDVPESQHQLRTKPLNFKPSQ